MLALDVDDCSEWNFLLVLIGLNAFDRCYKTFGKKRSWIQRPLARLITKS